MIYIAGHNGMVGSAIRRHLISIGHPEDSFIISSHDELDLTEQAAVQAFFETREIDQVYLAAAKVGGIHANSNYPAEFIYDNLMIESNVINAAFHNNVKKLLFLGSSCIYPKLAEQPMREEALLTGTLEPTNEPYAIAKIAGIKLCESYNRQYGASHGIDYRCLMPSNLYGPKDNYSPESSHVIPALIRRFHEAVKNKANSVTVWGTGRSRREFLFVNDMASACVHVMNLDRELYEIHAQPMLSHINVGYGKDITIEELAELIARVTGYKGEIIFDSGKPDGTPSKLLDSTLINNLGWQAKTSIEQGLEATYQDFIRVSSNRTKGKITS